MVISHKNRTTVITAIVIFALLLILAKVSDITRPRVPLKSSHPAFEVLHHDNPDKSGIEQYAILIPARDNGKDAAQFVESRCEEWPCNVEIFDNKRAFQLYEHYKNQSSWTNDDFVFAANHYVGSIYFESGTYVKYPFKQDQQYKEFTRSAH